MEDVKHKLELIEKLRQRKHQREIQLAQLGVSADPVVKTELYEIEKQITTLQEDVEKLRGNSNNTEDDSFSMNLSCSPLFWIVEVPVKLGVHFVRRLGRKK